MGLYSRWLRRQAVQTPTSILGANCVVDLQRGVGLGYSSAPDVNAWADQSGTGNDFVALFTEPTDTGGADGLDFNGSTHALECADDATLDVTTAMVLGIKLKPDVVTSNRVPISKGPSTGGSWSMQTNSAAMRVHIGTPGINFGEASSMLSAGTSAYFLVIFDGSQSTNATRLVMRRNGSAASFSFTGTIPASIPVGTDVLAIGRYANGVQYWDGKIAAVFMGNVVPSAGQITALEAYLAGA